MAPHSAVTAKRGIWGRQLDRYPSHGPRALYLGIVVLATITLYYELYVQGSVATRLAASLHMTLVYLISISIVGNAVGALASVVAGLADRWGRANLVVYGLGLTGVLVLFGLAGAHSRGVYLMMFACLGFVEGIILVATPALIRDFSPQLGRASAMGFWTLGPVAGSLVVSEVASHTLNRHPDWQYQFRICGIVGLAVFVLAFLGLRELAPRLRDQLMVSLRDRALIEARARGIDPDQAGSGHWRQMLRLDIIGPAFAISIYLLFYYIAVGFFVVFFATAFGYSEDRANALANWYWSFQCIALIVTGLVSDWLRVRKPFMVAGAVISSVGIALFALATTHPETTYHHFVGIILLISIGSAVTFASWMAGFTETVERRNPAATATGLAVWGSMLRTVVVVALLGLIAVIPAASTLVDQGSQVAAAAAGRAPMLTDTENATVRDIVADPGIPNRVQAIAAQDAPELATAQKLTPDTQAALQANPGDPTAQAQALSEISGLPLADVTKVLALSAQSRAALAHASSADLALLASDATPVRNAADQLKALAAVPAADLALVAKYGIPLQDTTVLAQLHYLQREVPVIQQAQKDNPRQWQTWWWICFGGGVLFLPFVWLLNGRWSPARAKADAAAHHDAVRRELKALRQSANR